jgi:lysophospholipase L1-like esterase
LVALCLSTIIGIAVAEVGVRLLRPQFLSVWAMTKDDIVVHRANIRGFTTVHGKRFETNSIGMRDSERTRTKAPGSYRILLFGDSFMEATQVEWEDSLPYLLEKKLAARLGQPVEVINLSVSGWGTDAQLAYFERHASDYVPDLVLIAMTLHNDVADNLAEQYHQFEAGELRNRPAQELPPFMALRQKTQEWLAGHSQLYQLVVGSLRARRVIESGQALDLHVAQLLSPSPTSRIEQGWLLTYSMLDRVRGLATEQGADFAIFLVPLVYSVVDTRLEEFLSANRLGPTEIDLLRPQRLMKRWGERRNVQVIDLQPEFHAWAGSQNSDPYLTSDGHWTEDGHRLGAEQVARELKPRRPR